MGANTAPFAVIEVYFKDFTRLIYAAFRTVHPAQHAFDTGFRVKLRDKRSETRIDSREDAHIVAGAKVQLIPG
jgi:hypothetical protein